MKQTIAFLLFAFQTAICLGLNYPSREITFVRYGMPPTKSVFERHYTTTAAKSSAKPDRAKNRLPKGSAIKNGKILVLNGYKPVFSSNKKIVFIVLKAAQQGDGVSGTYACNCGDGSGGCELIVTGNVLACSGGGCCRMTTTVLGAHSTLSMQEIENHPEKLVWRKVIFPPKRKAR